MKCPICRGQAVPHDVVDFNKSCEEKHGKFLPLSGEPIYYNLCHECGFCFAPSMYDWTAEMFAEKVYNDDYIKVDPEYAESRPRSNADFMSWLFPNFPAGCRHLDYGGGNGALSRILRQRGWDSTSYDPFANRDVDPATLGRFDLISAFEVFEHFPDVRACLDSIVQRMRQPSVLLFGTLVSDGSIRPNERLSWWYAAPRNGHVNLFTNRSLRTLAKQYGFTFATASADMHIFVRWPPPEWARVLFAG
jgi:hypothetical protein